MYRLKYLLISLCLLYINPIKAQYHPINIDKNWEIIFQDNCDTFNSQLWYKCHSIHGNEQQVYTPNNVYNENGKLVLCLKNEISYFNSKRYKYTSGQIMSNENLHYGYYEIFAKIPASSGYWPAFWFWNNASNWYNEIDVFEGNGAHYNYLTYNYFCNINSSECPQGNVDTFYCDYSTKYHWYGIEWSKDYIIWYIDRKVIKIQKNNFNGVGIQHPMKLILNVALFPKNEGWGSPINANTIIPNYMYIEQINGYKLKYDCESIVDSIGDFNQHNYSVKKKYILGQKTPIRNIANPNKPIILRASDEVILLKKFIIPLHHNLIIQMTNCEH